MLRTKPTALFVEAPEYSDMEALGRRIEAEVQEYQRAYDEYFEDMCTKKNVEKTKLDSLPRVILLPGFGMVTMGRTLADANIVADVYEHTMSVMMDADDIGSYRPVSREDLFDVEYWSLEQAKLKRAPRAALSGAVALVTGAASGIGRATAATFAELGAHVTIVDRDEAGLDAVKKSLASDGRVTAIRADVTIEGEVRAAVAHSCRTFGGLDIIVSNAGDAPQGRLDTSDGAEALRASLEVNLLSHNHARARGERDHDRARAWWVSALQREQGVVQSGSELRAVRGREDGAPRAHASVRDRSRPSRHSLERGERGSHSHESLRGRRRGATRARARSLRRRILQDNLLSREVTAEDVAQAFAHLAQARATTGCVVTVDGGNPAAFPR